MVSSKLSYVFPKCNEIRGHNQSGFHLVSQPTLENWLLPNTFLYFSQQWVVCSIVFFLDTTYLTAFLKILYIFFHLTFSFVCVCCTIKSLCDHWASMSVGLCKACCVCAESCLPFHDLVQLNKLRQGSLYMWRTLWCHYLVAHSRSAWWVLPAVAHCKDLKKRFCETWHYYLLFCLFMIL